MWTACCNWFCLNGPPEDLPHCPPAGTRAYANAGYSSFPSPTGLEQSCRACRARLQTSSLKCICLDCKNHFCPACSHQPEGGPCLCHLCQRLRATGFRREELLKVKVKDLRDYLELREVSTATCREKEELVGLILGQQPPAAPPGDWTTLVPPATPIPDNQEQRLPVPASPDRPPGQPSSAQPASQPEGERQANGHVLPSQDMEDVENAGENVTEEETQSIDLEDHLVAGRRASLSDLTSVGDIGALSVRQLKEILARNFVNYKGCCEKWELMERVTRLYKEKDLQQLVSGTDNQAAPSGHAALPGSEDNLCKVCMDSVIDCVLLECGHMVTCTKCGKRMNECPICRQYVVRAVHVFRT